jgi:glycosidase
MVWLANANPAFGPFEELFDDDPIAHATAYRRITGVLRDYFETRPRFGPDNQNLVDMLRAPALASPDSLAGQIAFIRDRWKDLLGELLRRLLTGLDVLKEEELAIWLRFHPPGPHFGGPPGPGPSGVDAIPRYRAQDYEFERFSPDEDWMPRTVLVAKSAYVWLDQLSRAYGRWIKRLDEIPDEELETLARRGFNAVWLIGVWERSRASERIKRLCGNPEAIASAYSLHDYVIASDLGGEDAYATLRDRARARGIRLASDMVPNHMAIDSRWVIEHPDWFLALPYSPFPSYRFEGPDLSSDGRVEIKIEDHYYDRTDAAVVFRRVDRWTGDTHFIYHGNDGTSFPWNDTAQLNYLNADVREAVIQTILHVARQFPIIRFDAAMTLAKRHYQRLWFPEPGSGGAIPSRAEHGLTKPEFDAAMPVEFWRELVDRVAAEAPGTLLLAEAFWLMEGYFVRTLGMHRVYNSAFMNMLRDEENANYRSVIKNTLEFDPDVLKRYVNFMNNPDERTAVEQFGKGDKYFGVCTLMSTLPGLPMFGHGQVEGYTEKYGMEYRKAYHDEQPDQWLVARHDREISPLLYRRALFADVREFLLYDFFTDDGWVNEDVFAYSNRRGRERGLVVYHNRYAQTRGWIRLSCAYAEKTADGGKRLLQRTIGEAFGLARDPTMFVAYRDALSGLEYLHRAADVVDRGLRLELEAYTCRVFLDWRDIRDDGILPWGKLADRLGGRGVPSLDDAVRALELEPMHDALRALLDPAVTASLADASAVAAPDRAAAALEEARRRVHRFLDETGRFTLGTARAGLGSEGEPSRDGEAAARWFEQRLRAALGVMALERHFESSWPPEARAVLPTLASPGVDARPVWGAVLAWCALESLGRLRDPAQPERTAAQLFDVLRLREPMAAAFGALGIEGEQRWRAAARVRAAFAHAASVPGAETVAGRSTSVSSWMLDPDVAWVIGVHDDRGTRYLDKEAFEQLVWWMALRPLLALAGEPRPNPAAVRSLERQISARLRAAAAAGYRVEALLEPARPETL